MTVQVIPGEFSPFTIAIAVLSGVILLFGYVSMFVKERLFLSEAFVALIVGIIAGPLVANGFSPTTWDDTDEITKELTRCVIAIQVMAVGIELPKHYLKKEWRTMFFFLIPVMIFMWLVSGLFIYALIPPLDYLHALVIAACVCPTDPILANSVVKGRFAEKHVPAHIRNALSAESGANDGMGFPFLFLALFLINEPTVGEAIGKWIYLTLLFQILLSCVIGAVVGWVACKTLQWSEKRHLIDKPSFLSFGIAFALFLMSMTGFSGSDDVLACFVAGNAFSWDEWFRKETEEAHFQDVIDMMLNMAVFVYIGAIIPWSEFGNTEIGLTPWRLVVIGILILLFRRLPIVLALKPFMPAMKTYREAAFSGWFGPMGVGAVFLAMIAKEELEYIYAGQQHVSVELVVPVVLFVVLSSTLVHGTTIPLFKIGKRIRTRTLSITSTGSSQVLRLPKIHRGDHHHHHHGHGDDAISRHSFHEGMSEVERNTLFNTLQQQRLDEEAAAIKAMAATENEKHQVIDIGGNVIVDDDDEDEFDDEDFLPGEEEDEIDTDQLSAPARATPISEAQSIRFVEPVNPRLTTATTTNGNNGNNHANLLATNANQNELSVNSIRGWLQRHGPLRHKDVEATKQQEPSSSSSSSSDGGDTATQSSSTHHLQDMFRHGTAASTSAAATDDSDSLDAVPSSEMPNIKVWDEEHNIVVEDTETSTSEVVPKQGKWHDRVRDVIHKMEQEDKQA
ncbi:Sodium/hydrogen exchanger family-domain-containing protein [Gongronella butleri]|nr:Sodium/hydrogen exchanger family-domain-containing protein [Gongronella butleri]